MIRDALIFMCGAWTGAIAGMFVAGAAVLARRADDAERDRPKTLHDIAEAHAGDLTHKGALQPGSSLVDE
jgi:hypothetical protein